MNKNKTTFLIAILSVFLLWNCNKEEETDDVVRNDAPVCELTIEGGQTAFNYGDTITLKGEITKNYEYIRHFKFYIDGIEHYKVSGETEFTQVIYTKDLALGPHVLKILARNFSDSIGADSAQINVVGTAPIIGSGEVLNVGTDSATITGEFISDGGYTSTWGICYNTTGSPTKDENSSVMSDSSFSVKLTGLTKKTEYYIRVWGKNELGIAYGEEIKFITSDETGTFTDFRDDHVYRWVKIGNQVWMAENLAYLPFLTDPTVLPEKDSNIWVYGYKGMDIEEAKQTENYKTYGALYSWKMANKYCPTGWHLPDPTEWNELIDYLGGEEGAGGKMKERGTEHWEEPNLGATNESGFTALPGGLYYSPNSSLESLGSESYFRNSTSSVLYFLINNNKDFFVGSSGTKKEVGASVRCIKD